MQHDPEWPPSSPRSLRQAIEEILAKKPFLKVFLFLLLGPAADRPRDLETSLFLPHELMDQVGGLWVQGLSGRESFVSKPSLLYKAAQEEPTGGSETPIPILVSLLVLSGFIAAFAPRTRLLALIFDSVLFGTILLVGLSILLLWWVAGYQEVGMNTNLLWATPFPLIGLMWGRFDGRRSVSTALFALESIGAIIVAVFGGLAGQTISPEVRIVCAIILIRCATRLRLPPSVQIIMDVRGTGAGK